MRYGQILPRVLVTLTAAGAVTAGLPAPESAARVVVAVGPGVTIRAQLGDVEFVLDEA